jgi:hypothetical protein
MPIRIRPVEAVQDLHQGALSCAVLAEQGMDLAGMNVQIDLVIGHDTRKGFADPAQ